MSEFYLCRATATLYSQLLFKDTTVLQLCEEGGTTFLDCFQGSAKVQTPCYASSQLLKWCFLVSLPLAQMIVILLSGS